MNLAVALFALVAALANRLSKAAPGPAAGPAGPTDSNEAVGPFGQSAASAAGVPSARRLFGSYGGEATPTEAPSATPTIGPTEAPTATPTPAPGSLLQKIRAPNPSGGALFGLTVAAFGNNLVVGESQGQNGTNVSVGLAHIFATMDAGATWSFVQELAAPDGAAGDQFGLSVAIYGNYVVVGAPADNTDNGGNSGSAYVYRTTDGGATWPFVAKLVAPDGAADDFFGFSVAVSENNVFVGAPQDDGGAPASGSVYVYLTTDGGATWNFTENLVSPDIPSGNEIFGWSVATFGNILVVGELLGDGFSVQSGTAHIFDTTDGGATWDFVQELIAPNGSTFDTFGTSVAIDGFSVVVGANGDADNGQLSGSAYVFNSTDGGATWGFVEKLVAPDGSSSDNFGEEVSIYGNYIIVGARFDDDNGDASGSAYVFNSTDGGATWGFVEKLLAPDGAPIDRFGSSVAISENNVFVGAPQDDDGGFNESGSVYIFHD